MIGERNSQPPNITNYLSGRSEEKVEEYLRAGVRLVWVIYPEVHAIQVIHGDGSGYRLRTGDELSGEQVVPGFRCQVASLFPAPQPADATASTPDATGP
jgi:Uma2 family endonuclease